MPVLGICLAGFFCNFFITHESTILTRDNFFQSSEQELGQQGKCKFTYYGLKGLKESVITRSPGCDHSAVRSYYEWSQVHSPHLSPFSLLAGKYLNTTAVIPLSYSTFIPHLPEPWDVFLQKIYQFSKSEKRAWLDSQKMQIPLQLVDNFKISFLHFHRHGYSYLLVYNSQQLRLY